MDLKQGVVGYSHWKAAQPKVVDGVSILKTDPVGLQIDSRKLVFLS